MASQTTKLSNGQEIPLIGIGTSTIDGVYEGICKAIDIGYRLIDTAALYKNEAEIGRAIDDKIKQGVVKREELFILTKLADDKHRVEAVSKAFEESLAKLRVDYVDLFLIHWPIAIVEDPNRRPEDPAVFDDDADYVDTWKEIEKLQKSGKARGIGLSNFNKAQLTRILDSCEIKPVVNQVECNLINNQERLKQFCEQQGIRLMAFSPLGAPGRTIIAEDAPKLLENKVVVELAKKYDKTPGQILLRNHIQRGVIAVPKSNNPARLLQNISVFDFVLELEDMERLEKENKNMRLVQNSWSKPSKFYPFHDEF